MVDVHVYLMVHILNSLSEILFVQRPKFSSVPRNSTDLLYSGLFLFFQGILLRACRLITSLLPQSFIPHLPKEFENVLRMALCFIYEPRKLQIIRSG